MNNIQFEKPASNLAALRAEFWSLPSQAWVDRETIAAAFFVSTVTMEALATKGGGPKYTRIGRRALYRKGDALAWAAETGRTVESTAQLTPDIGSALGVATNQSGFASLVCLGYMMAAALLVLIAMPDLFASMDWAGIAVLGAGVIGNSDGSNLIPPPNLRRIPFSHLIASAQPRPLLTQAVDKLAASIKDLGLFQPIIVTNASAIQGQGKPSWKIVAGHHRVAACRALGWTEIDAIVIAEEGHLQTELIEIDENLCRAELSASQRSKYTNRRAKIWEQLHPEEKAAASGNGEQVGTDFPPVAKHGRGQAKGFAASTSQATGMTKRSINQHKARAEALGEEALDKVNNTSLDSGVEIDALAKLPEEQRTALIDRASSGEQVSARSQTKPAPALTSDSGETRLLTLARKIRKALQGVVDESGCLDSRGLAQLVKHALEDAPEEEIEAITRLVGYLEKWFKDLKGAL